MVRPEYVGRAERDTVNDVTNETKLFGRKVSRLDNGHKKVSRLDITNEKK
jgi:hypothetical protein